MGGFEFTKEQARLIMSKYDKDGARLIAFDKFFEIMEEKYLQLDNRQEQTKGFQLFADEVTNRINLKTLKRVIRDLTDGSCTLADDELQAMIDTFDLNEDGDIDQAEFLKLVKK